MEKLFKTPTGQLAEIKQAIDRRHSTVVFYTSEYNRYHMASLLGRPFFYVAGDLISARRAYDALQEYCDGKVVLFPEREDVLISRKAVNPKILSERVSMLYEMAQGEINGVVLTAENLLQYYPKPELLLKSIVTVRKGEVCDSTALGDSLAQMGYKRMPLAENGGEFSIRGSIVDVYPPGGETPVRIELFGDETESIRRYDVETLHYKDELSEFKIYPATDIIVPRSAVNSTLFTVKKDKKELNPEQEDKLAEELERFDANPSSPLNTFFLPYLTAYTDTIFAYLLSDGAVVLDDTKQIEDKLRVYVNTFAQRVNALKQNACFFDRHKKSIADLDAVKNCGHTFLGFGRITSNVQFFVPQEVFTLKTTSLPPYYNDMPSLFQQLKALDANGARVGIVLRDENTLNALAETLRNEYVGFDVGENAGGISLSVGTVSKGFIYPTEKLVLIGHNDVSRKWEKAKSERQKRLVFELPEKGDYVVHEKHGIGISEGIQRISTPSGDKDYYVILYRDGDRLYLPCDQLDNLEKYNGGDTPSLHKIGGAEFERVKKRVKESVKKMALDLLALYRSRFGKKGHVYQSDTVWQKEMEESFEFKETDDQLIAISEIKRDMESGKIMDRLLCGDVGFGKTEVALRGVFKTVIEGKQAAILAPTTILAQQHYNLVRARFNSFNIKTDLLSRFVSPSETRDALRRIADGTTSVVVATHRILSKDVRFFDLGMLVLDEEQRFGVEHKEKLKVLRDKVNILSLSATPIPRTLHMALSGIRDISTLENPPKNRMPVETYVTEYSDNLLADAVNKEVARGGQVFILYNRVQSIDTFYKKVRTLLDSSVRIVYAHGQLDEEVLEDRIREFYDNEAQVLISTTIIENGIDLPNANTLFVVNAERLGLSQLYQLRGRVGRSNVQSYAYFTVPEGAVLTANAAQRLEALMDNTELGSGFRIAMRDLEIRGAGNVLGREQHGQMEKVGYELYLKLIKEGIDEMQGTQSEALRDIELKIDGDYALDEKYIPESRARVMFYKRVSTLQTKLEGQEYYEYLKKNYGIPPIKIRSIIRIGVLKNLARKKGVQRAVISDSGSGLYFYDNKCLTDEMLFDAMNEYRRYAVLSPSDPPVIVFDTKDLNSEQKIKLLLEFLTKACGNR